MIYSVVVCLTFGDMSYFWGVGSFWRETTTVFIVD
jgi:hypothetical protein